MLARGRQHITARPQTAAREQALRGSWRTFVCGIAVLHLACGCAVGPNFQRPDAPQVTQYSHGTQPTETISVNGSVQRFELGKAVTADWWRLFQSTKLDAVITEAIAKNPGLDAARASLEAGQDNLRSGYGIFYPAVDMD